MLRSVLLLAATISCALAFTGNATLPVGYYTMNANAPQILLTANVGSWVPYLFQSTWNQTTPTDGASIWEIRRYLPDQLHALGHWTYDLNGGAKFVPPKKIPRNWVPPRPAPAPKEHPILRWWSGTYDVEVSPSDTLPPPTTQVDIVSITTTAWCSSNHLIAVEVLQCSMLTPVTALDYCASNYMYDTVSPSPLEFQVGYVGGLSGFGITTLLGTTTNFFYTCTAGGNCAAPVSECS